MFIEKIKINNFRNIISEIIEPGKNINVIFGNNANGKTSFIESIYIVSNLQSFRTSLVRDIINFNSEKSEVTCFYEKNRCKEKLNFKISKSEREYLKNNGTVKIDEYLWSISTIVFHPDDILFINGSPGLKRQFLDRSIFYTDIEHINNLRKLNLILKNKNVCLREGKLDSLDEWDNLIAKYSYIIIKKRNEYINRLNNILKIKSDRNYEIYVENYKEKDLSEILIKNKIIENKSNEIRNKKSLIGAHRQSISVKLDNKCLKSYGSQGQKRAFMLLLKSSQIDDFFNINYFYPVLLLDDMASELDENNKKIILKLIKNFPGQTFITTIDKNILNFDEKVKYFEVIDGFIKPVS